MHQIGFYLDKVGEYQKSIWVSFIHRPGVRAVDDDAIKGLSLGRCERVAGSYRADKFNLIELPLKKGRGMYCVLENSLYKEPRDKSLGYRYWTMGVLLFERDIALFFDLEIQNVAEADFQAMLRMVQNIEYVR